MGGAKLISCPGSHLTSSRPCMACVRSCSVTMSDRRVISQCHMFCHNAWWCWRDTPDLLHISLIGKELCWGSFVVCVGMGRKIEVQETVKKAFNFLQAIFAPPSKWRPWHVSCLPFPRYPTAYWSLSENRSLSSTSVLSGVMSPRLCWLADASPRVHNIVTTLSDTRCA